jgi:phospholipid/cholesterol/gamma-HCH transport system ATP-binding protein
MILGLTSGDLVRLYRKLLIETMSTDSSTQQGVRLQIRGLRKSYDGREVLKGIDFEVNPGEIFVIMGPSGSGKSVLLRQLIGLEEPNQGEVLVNGQPIQPPELATRYRVAMVFQSGALLTSMTVGENVGFYLTEHHLKSPDEIAEIVSKDLEQVGLKGTENKMPDELSGGMKKRVAIARALVVEPQLIFYDEPTSELDPVSSMSIAEDIIKLNKRTHATSVVVSHDRGLAFGIANRIAVLDEGRILAIGTPDEIKRNPDPRLQYFLNASVAKIQTPPASLRPQRMPPETQSPTTSHD